MVRNDVSGATNAVRVAGLELYRYFLTDFMPGVGVGLVLAYYLRQYQPMREIAEDYAFLSQIGGGLFLIGLIFGLAFGGGLVINLLSAIAFARITDAATLTRLAVKLQLTGGLGELEALARQVIELAKAKSRVAAIGLDGRPSGPGTIAEVQTRVGIWLDREHPEDFQRMERYGGAAVLCRSLAGVVLLTWVVEAHRYLTGQDLGVTPAWFPTSAAALVVLLFASTYADVYRTRWTLQIGRQRLHELDPPASPEDTA